MVTRTIYSRRLNAISGKLLSVPKTQYISHDFIFYSVIGLLQVLSENDGIVKNRLDGDGGLCMYG